MATVIVHDVDEGALERLRAETERQGGSVEAELRAFIKERGRANGVSVSKVALLDDLRAHQREMLVKYGPFPDTTEWIRQDREAW